MDLSWEYLCEWRRREEKLQKLLTVEHNVSNLIWVTKQKNRERRRMTAETPFIWDHDTRNYFIVQNIISTSAQATAELHT